MNVIKNILGERRFARGYERSRNKRSQIYLKDPRAKKKPIGTYVWPDQPNKIFIGYGDKNIKSIKQVSDTLGHEELHNYLQKTQGINASIGLDNIAEPGLYNDKGEMVNIQTHTQILGPKSWKEKMKRDAKPNSDLTKDDSWWKI